ncbi:uncharacterized protein EDB93DRAFT_1055087, partial [Suillus bovinus]|uniref:uncharacterized protein n=1 Tax=Suillus bovinus TaxID=48563 RepID=UPI001B868D4C
SQLPPVFTNAYAMQEEEHLHKHQAETLKHELAVTAKNTVMAFGWAADESPTICEFQSGFVLPCVRVTNEWLWNLVSMPLCPHPLSHQAGAIHHQSFIWSR